MSIDPTAITTENEALLGQPQEAAEVREAISPQVQEARAGEPALPEKFKGRSLEEIVKSYENLESEFSKTKQTQRDLEHKVGVYQEVFKNPQAFQPQKGPSEDEVFLREWEQNPAQATFNQTQRVLARSQALNSQMSTNLFVQNAKNDESNYPDFKSLEPRMMELAPQLQHLVNPGMINSPQVVDVLYKLARSESMAKSLQNAKMQGSQEAENRRKEVSKAGFEGPTPSKSAIDPKDMTLEQLEKELGFYQR